MQLTQNQEAEVLRAYQKYFDSYMAGDIETVAGLLDENYTQVGSAEAEVFFNKKDAIQFLYDTIEQVAGKVEMRNRVTKLDRQENVFIIHEFADLYALADDAWIFYAKFRASTFMQYKVDAWKIIHQHSSFPDTKAEVGQNIAVDKVAEENQLLREAVKRRTIELEEKNRDLEVETSLERVRAVAMGMKQPADMLDICRVITDQLLQLRIKDIRNVQTAIIDESKGTYQNFEYYKLHDKTIITEVDYHHHKMTTAFVSQMLNGPEEIFSKSLNGKELRDWFEHQKSTNQFIDNYLETAPSLNYYWYSIGPVALGLSTYTPLSEAEITLLKRFRNVFELAYRRFMDIEKAEAQAREAQIELALERVRASTMAMQKSDELAEVSSLLFQQLKWLGVNSYSSGFTIWDNDNKNLISWMCNADGSMNPPFTMPIAENEWHLRQYDSWKNGEDFILKDIAAEEMQSYFRYLRSFPLLNEAFEKSISAGHPMPERQVHHAANFTQGNLLFITLEPCPDAHNIFQRFAKVFEQTYTRFLDLQKAEAQTREAQIENVLEKVRSRTMAMQRSEELPEAANNLFLQMQALGISAWSAGYCIWDEDKKAATAFMSSEGVIQKAIKLPTTGDPSFVNFYEAYKRGETLYVEELGGEALVTHYKFMRTLPVVGEVLDGIINAGFQLPTFQIFHVAFFSHGYLLFITYEPVPEMWDVFKRFAKVFEQTYTRFLDLQKAEAQAREAQIEAGLERVRSKTMAMHRSNELTSVISVLSDQFLLLGFNIHVANFNTSYRERDWNLWLYTPGYPVFSDQIHIPYFDHPYFNRTAANLAKGQDFSTEIFDKKEKDGFLDHLYTNTIAKHAPDERKEFTYTMPGFAWSVVYLKNTAITIANYDAQPYSEEQNLILRRFGNVFEQSYTRFLDLQKSEAQARESQIELGLERVRARAMAMQKSEELKELIATVFIELTKLDLVLTRCLIMIYDPESNASTWWMANSEAPNDPIGLLIKYHEYRPYLAYLNAWRERALKWQYVLEGEDKKLWDDFLFTETELSLLPSFVIEGMKEPTKVYLNASFNSFGNLTLATLESLSDQQFDLLLRFAKVFDLTYTRFNDLQKAEANATEAKIEASLERVRSKAMSMHSSQDLADTIGVFYHELELFSITPRRCGVGLIDKETHITELSTMNTTEQGKSIEIVGRIKLVGHPVLESIYDNWLLNKEYHPVLKGNEIREYYQLLKPQIAFPEYPHDAIHYGYFFYFPEGGVYAWTDKQMVEDELKIYRRFTSVLSLTYKRYKDLKIAEAHAQQSELDLIQLKEEKKRTEEALNELKETQKQLIQSEKMASLGELTAGIAHEIQNPLNFVNNFSEVSNELIDEMIEEVAKGNFEEVKAIADDVKQNLVKINHHGKRADGIVKGMLQHSRTSSATKEPTDINKLVDEYLRLAYHGLKAKDKTFNATLKTEFDESIGKIPIIPQDMGRVILNLITNAFYVVGEKSQQKADGYEPTVSVSTKRIGDKIEITVKDNGCGIPPKVLDKIFQPFFTTKPTGQGTGLGLSLAYDVVKVHSGELKVQTKEGEGSEFIIQLPV